MAKTKNTRPTKTAQIKDRVPTGIDGLDLVLNGGYPRGCPTVIRGSSGCGKTMFALAFAARAKSAKKTSVFLTFDEAPERLTGYIKDWNNENQITFIDARPPIAAVVTGRHVELTAILVRIEQAIKKTGATHLVIDAIDTLFETFGDRASVHQGISQIFNWSRENRISLVATAGETTDYRIGTGILDYASDCTINLGQDIDDGLMTRSIRVVKSRGSPHGTNAYPYIIHGGGVSISPITETRMTAKATTKRISSGNAVLDEMLGGKGFWAGSTVMVSGQSGSGKSLLAARMAESSLNSKMKVLYYTFEESPEQFVRDVASAGIRLKPHLDSGNLIIRAERPVERSLEEHIIRISRLVRAEQPDVVLLDPISSINDLGNSRAFKSAVIRLTHYLKSLGCTVILTELLPDNADNVSSINISSLVDTWVRLRRGEFDHELQREIYVHKSRGSKTMSQILKFKITNSGFVINNPVE